MAVYDGFYGLSISPFSLNPDPGFLFLSRGHREALAGLKYAVRDGKGFAVLSGEVGTGKTTLVHALLTELRDEIRTAIFFNPSMSRHDLYWHLLGEFQLPEQRTMVSCMRTLQRFLLEQFKAGVRVVVIIDEAHALSRRILEEVRLLSNFETSKSKLLQVLLVGQPELMDRLRKPAMRQLRQRIALSFELLPLQFEDTVAYVRWRLRVAGAATVIFLPAAYVRLHRFSGGLPRLINLLCDHALVKGFVQDRHEIDAGLIVAAARELGLRPVARVGLWRRLAMRQRHAWRSKNTDDPMDVPVPMLEVGE